jgi:proteasome-associated ATPase
VVKGLVGDTHAEVTLHDGSLVVFIGGAGTLTPGDRVMLDPEAVVIVRKLDGESSRFASVSHEEVDWDAIGGLEEAKRLMREAVELPRQKPHILKRYGRKPVKGILLYGPPGCGKTMLGRAAATSIARMHGKKGESPFFYVKGPEVLDQFVGNAELAIRLLFSEARDYRKAHGIPAVIFVDEADALLSKRSSAVTSHVERTIVPAFLAEMDGMEESGALVILATNRQDVLDPAIVRDGRIDYSVHVNRPSPQAARDIVLTNLKDVPLAKGVTRDALAQLVCKELYSKKRVLRLPQGRSGSEAFTLGALANGAMIAGIVQRAISHAIRRDIAADTVRGVRMEDVVSAVDEVQRGQRDLDHTDAMMESARGEVSGDGNGHARGMRLRALRN